MFPQVRVSTIHKLELLYQMVWQQASVFISGVEFLILKLVHSRQQTVVETLDGISLLASELR